MAQSTTFAAVTIQSATFTAKRLGVPLTITYKNGGTAGSEVVTMDSSFNVTIQIQSGVSTNTQIVAAVNAATQMDGRGAGDYITASTSSGSTTPTCTTLVPLAGGVTAAVKASKVFGALRFTAHTAGAAGNSLQVRFTSGATAGSEVVTDPNSNGAPLTIQIANGVSTFAQIKTAIETWQGGHTTYFDLASSGPSLGQPAYTALAPAAVALSGGADAAAATVTVNGITITSKTNDATQNGLTFTLTPGATAGAEVVTVDGSGNVSVQIQSGTSTRTQIKTALDAAVPFSTLYTSSVTSGATANQAVYQNALTGASTDPGYAWYRDDGVTALTSSFVYFPFGSDAEDIHVKNDEASGNKTIIGSWDGINNHFIIKATESWDAYHINRPGVFLKYGTGAPAYRAWTVNR